VFWQEHSPPLQRREAVSLTSCLACGQFWQTQWGHNPSWHHHQQSIPNTATHHWSTTATISHIMFLHIIVLIPFTIVHHWHVLGMVSDLLDLLEIVW